MLSLKAFGSLDVHDVSGRSLTALLSQSKRAALLAYLVLSHPEDLYRRDHLLALFWPELDQKHGRNALSQALSFLRRRLGKGVLVSRGAEEVGIDVTRITSDVRVLEEALARGDWSAAVQAYGGDLLEGLHVIGAGPFLDWMDRERKRLREAVASAAWTCAHEKIAAGELTEAERMARRALALVPTDESPVRRFIEALARAGDRAAAINFYEEFATVLEEELEVGPGPRTVRLVAELRGGEGAPPPASSDVVSTALHKENAGAIAPRSDGSPRPTAPALPEVPARRRSALLLLPALALGAAAVAIGLLRQRARPEPRNHGPTLVAVAPFEAPTRGSELDILGSYIATMVGERLEEVGLAEVLPVSTVAEALEVAEADSDPRAALARTSGARIVVTGKLFPLGDSVRIHSYWTSLLDNGDPQSIESVVVSIDEPGTAARIVQDRVAAVLAHNLDDSYGWKSVDRPPASFEAYVEYRRAQEVKRQMGDWNDVASHLLRALELDPSYHAAALDAVGVLHYVGRHQERDSIVRVLESSRDRLPEFYRQALDWLNLSIRGERELVLQMVRRMAETHPLEMAYNLGLEAQRNNVLAESVEALGRWERGDGRWIESFVASAPEYFGLYCDALHMLPDYEKELAVAREGERRFPAEALEEVDFVLSALRARVALGRIEEVVDLASYYRETGQLPEVWPVSDELVAHGHEEAATALLEDELSRGTPTWPDRLSLRERAHLLHRLGRDSEAHVLWQRIANEHPASLETVGSLGVTAAKIGDIRLALEMDARLGTWPDSLNRGRHTFWRAKIATALGDKARAVELLYRVPTLGWAVYLEAHRDFDLRPLAGYPSFQTFLEPRRSPPIGS